MGLWDMIKGEFIDVIEWTDDSQDTMAWRFPRYDKAIKNGARLTVRESQNVVFVHQGEFADVFGPGLHTLTTNNIPILTTLKSWKYALNSPFKADAIFVNTKNFTGLGWGTQSAVTMSDPRFGMYEVKARGTYAMKITDPALFIKEVAGTDSNFSTDEIKDQLRSIIVSQFMDALGESGLGADQVASNFNELSKLGLTKMNPELTAFGVQLTRFVVENIEMPEHIKKEIYEYSRLNSQVDIDKLTRLKTAQAIEKAAENPGGLAGAGMGMGLGMNMANQMANASQQAQQQQQQQQQQQAPPPVPMMKYFVVLEGKQAGPFDMPEIQNLVSTGKVNQSSLVWKHGMSGWEKAESVDDFKSLFGQVPPPLPI